MCVSVCIFVSFTVFWCTASIAFSFFYSFTYTLYLSVCMFLAYVYGTCCLILNKMMMMISRPETTVCVETFDTDRKSKLESLKLETGKT